MSFDFLIVVYNICAENDSIDKNWARADLLYGRPTFFMEKQGRPSLWKKTALQIEQNTVEADPIDT